MKRLPLALSLALSLFAVPALRSFSAGGLPVAIPPGSSSLDLTAVMDYCQDADPRLGVEDLAAGALDASFAPAAGRQVWTGRKAPVSWMRFSLQAAPGDPARRILELRPSFSIILDRAVLYLPREGDGYEELVAGALSPMRKGEAHSAYFLFTLPPSALSGKPCFLRIESGTDVEVHLAVWDEAALARRDYLDALFHGLLFGTLLAIAIYSVFLFVSLRDRAYLYYVLYLASAISWLFWVQGDAQALLGRQPALSQRMLWLSAGSLLAWGAVFSLTFLRIRKDLPILRGLLLAFAAAGALGAVTGVLGLQRAAFLLTNYTGVALPVLVIAAGIVCQAKGHLPARFFLLAWSSLALGGIAFSLMGLKVLPVSFWTVNGTAIGMALEALLLSMALADRFRRLEDEKAGLERAKERYRTLSLTDELTGLFNKRVMLTELAAATRSAAEGHELSAILLDIDDFKGINDSWGHGFGDRILKVLAATIRGCVRDKDIPCRFGGEEFVIIMPDTKAEDALRVAERIRTSFASMENRPDGAGGEEGDGIVTATASLGVTQFHPGESSETFLTRADDAMYEAKRAGKNRSVIREA